MQRVTGLLMTALMLTTLSGCSYLFYPRAGDYATQAKGANGAETLVNLTSMMEASSLLKDLVRSGYAELLIVILALSVVGWPGLARLVRAQVLSAKNSLYIEAARSSGVNTWRIIRQHILPNILAPIIVVLSMSLGGAVVAESGLSFLGLGVEPPIPSWGNMIIENASNGLWRTANAPYLVWAPGAIVSLLVFAFSFIGDGLNEALNPQMGEGSR